MAAKSTAKKSSAKKAPAKKQAAAKAQDERTSPAQAKREKELRKELKGWDGVETVNNPHPKARSPLVEGTPEVGVDGKNPVSVNNPPPKAALPIV